ncbi:MAG: nuclear transport factor 2 family protein [Cyclobacteriaceae bacterium]
MKKTLITFAILLLGTASWAQTHSAEEKAIIKVLEKESEAAQKRDYDRWIACFAQSEDVAFGFTHLFPTYMVRSYDKLAELGIQVFQDNPVSSTESFEFTDFNIRVNGTSAFVTYLQTNTQQDGTKDRYHKAEYLEKIDGEWKMIGHFFAKEPQSATGAG